MQVAEAAHNQPAVAFYCCQWRENVFPRSMEPLPPILLLSYQVSFGDKQVSPWKVTWETEQKVYVLRRKAIVFHPFVYNLLYIRHSQ